VHQRNLFHSFPRPKTNESEGATLERGLSILASMKETGLVLAPEIVDWDVSVISGGAEQLRILQRRACFTELSAPELAAHSTVFGPIALSFDIAALRAAGATPVIYVPQGVDESPLSQIGTFCVRGAYHTRYILRQLLGLKEMSDPAIVAARYGKPVAPNFELNLRNTDGAGNVVADYKVPASTVREVLQHVGFNNIPFDHSIGVLSAFLNMFYPTDDEHTGDELGYYRQREWRLIAGDINFGGRPMGRSLTESEITMLQRIDPQFWNRELTVDGVQQPRSALALVYDPVPDWNLFDLVEAIFVPHRAIERVRSIVGDRLPVLPSPNKGSVRPVLRGV
jgi:hypothetical protein